jgi:hypothetical protein
LSATRLYYIISVGDFILLIKLQSKINYKIIIISCGGKVLCFNLKKNIF